MPLDFLRVSVRPQTRAPAHDGKPGMHLTKKPSKGRWIQFAVAMMSAVIAVLQLRGPRHILIGFVLCAVGGAIGASVLVRRNLRQKSSAQTDAVRTENNGAPSNTD